MLDAAPPAMVWVDGCENGDYMDSAEEYLRATHEMRSWNGAYPSVAPAGRPESFCWMTKRLASRPAGKPGLRRRDR